MENNTNHSRLKLFPYQKETILEIEKLNGRSLLALEMGLGKTIITLELLERNSDWLPALIVCPASVKYNWEHEASTHTKFRPSICEGQKPPTFNNMGMGFSTQPSLTIINYDILMYWIDYLKKLKFKTIVFDESQMLANSKTKRTKAAKKIAKKFKQVIALSGTPLTNRPSELWPILNILWPVEYDSFWSYAQRYCNPKLTPWGWDYTGSSNLPQLHTRLKQKGMIRRKKADVLKDLPEKVRQIVPCELSDFQEYQSASTDFLSWIKKNKGHKLQAALKAEGLFKVGELLRLTARLKLKSVVNWINEFLDKTDEKIILFAVHQKAIRALERKVNAQSVTIDGSVTGRKRQLAIKQFQNDPKTRVFIGNIIAAGIGINLTAARTVGFVEMCWRPGDHVQAEDRPHRIGQTRKVKIKYFVAESTIEVNMCKILQKKQKVISAVLDGESNSEDLNLYTELLEELERQVK